MTAAVTALRSDGSSRLAAARAWSGSRPDPALAAAGIEGEALVANVRLAAMAMLLITPTVKLVVHGDDPVNRWGFAVTATAALAAVAIWWLLRSGSWRPWLGFASSALDVSLVSTALVTFVFVGSPLVGLNSKVTFEIYFLAIVATSLRYDARICLSVGILAWLQYASLWAYAASRFDLYDPRYAADSGVYSPIDQVTRLILLGLTVVLALTLVRRAQRLLQLGACDRLTGLYNRGQFDRALELEIQRHARYERPLSLAILDVDHFKRVNDDHGHPVGDRALRAIAGQLAAGVRRTDLVARYGGEEFVVLFPETARHNALLRIESLRRAVAARPLDVGDGRKLVLGFSAGIASAPDDAGTTTAEALLARADARLLAAKRAGRGCSIATG